MVVPHRPRPPRHLLLCLPHRHRIPLRPPPTGDAGAGRGAGDQPWHPDAAPAQGKAGRRRRTSQRPARLCAARICTRSTRSGASTHRSTDTPNSSPDSSTIQAPQRTSAGRIADITEIRLVQAERDAKRTSSTICFLGAACSAPSASTRLVRARRQLARRNSNWRRPCGHRSAPRLAR